MLEARWAGEHTAPTIGPPRGPAAPVSPAGMSAPASGGTAVHRITHASVTVEGKAAARLEDWTCWLQLPGGLGTRDRLQTTAPRSRLSLRDLVLTRPPAARAITTPRMQSRVRSPVEECRRYTTRGRARSCDARRGASELPEASRSLATLDKTLGSRPLRKPRGPSARYSLPHESTTLLRLLAGTNYAIRKPLRAAPSAPARTRVYGKAELRAIGNDRRSADDAPLLEIGET